MGRRRDSTSAPFHLRKVRGANHPAGPETHPQSGCDLWRQGQYRDAEAFECALRWQLRSGLLRRVHRGARRPNPRQCGPRVSGPRRVQRGGGDSSSARWRSGKRPLVRTIPTWGRPSTIWPSCIEPRASTAEAEGLFERALAIREKALGASHPDMGQTLNDLANLYRDQRKFLEAERLLRRALTIREQALGPSHPDVAATRHDLAAAASGQGHTEAKEAKADDVTSLAVAQILHNRALASRRQGKYGEAEELTSARWRSGKRPWVRPSGRGPDPQQSGPRISRSGQVRRG